MFLSIHVLCSVKFGSRMVCALFCLWSFLLLMSFCTYACFCCFIRFCKYVVYKYSRTILWERSCFQPESVLSQIRSSLEVVKTGFYSVCCLLSSFLNFITGIRNRLSDVAKRSFPHCEKACFVEKNGLSCTMYTVLMSSVQAFSCFL